MNIITAKLFRLWWRWVYRRMPSHIIPCDSHEYYSCGGDVLLCRACGHRCAISALSRAQPPCRHHFEARTSGWTDIRTGRHWYGGEMILPPGGG